MSISLRSADQDALEGVPDGHTYRLSDDQYRRTIEAGIIPDQVGLRDGFLRLKPDGGDYRLSVDQYRAMADADILTADDRIELLEGWLVAKMTKHPPHTIAKGLTRDALADVTPEGWFVTTEDPVTALDSDPEPDISIVRGMIRDYPDRAPGPRDVALIVEVADASLPRDRSMKKRLYARSGFGIYWLINLARNRIEVYTDPTGPVEEPDYLGRQDFGPDEMIPVVIEGREVGRLAVRDLLP